MRWFVISACFALLAGCAEQGRTKAMGNLPDLRIADAATASGLPQTALAVTREILQSDPRNVGALLRQADALMSMGQSEAAEECYRRVLEIDARSADGLRGLGRAYLAKGEVHEAEATFRKAHRRQFERRGRAQ